MHFDRLETTITRHSCLKHYLVHKSKSLDSSPSDRLAAVTMTKRRRRITTTTTTKAIACGYLLSAATTATAFGGAFTPPAPRPPPPPVSNFLSGRQKVTTLFLSPGWAFSVPWAGASNIESSRGFASRRFAHHASCRGRSDMASHERAATRAGWRSSGGRASTNGSGMMPPLRMSAVMEPPAKVSTRLPERTRVPREGQDRWPLEVFSSDNMSSLVRLIPTQDTGRRRADVADAATASAARGSGQPASLLRINRSRSRPQRFISRSSNTEQRELGTVPFSSSFKAVVRQKNRSRVTIQLPSPYAFNRKRWDRLWSVFV